MNLHQHLRFIGVIFVLLSLLGTSRMQSQNQRVTMLEDGPQATVFKGTLPGFYLSSAEVKSSGIEFQLFLSGVAETNIDEYGIIWNDNARPDYYKNTGRYAFSEPVTDGAHTYEIKNLPLNKSYFAYAYIIVGKKMIVSNEIYFFTSQTPSKMMRTNTAVSTGCGGLGETIFLDTDNENNAGTGVADNDFGVNGGGFSIGKDEPNHPIEFNLFTTKEALMDGILAINAYDVDEDDFNSSPEKIPEIDEVYFEGELLGHLSGNNNIFNTTTFRVPKEKIKKGKNRIEIRVSQPYNGVSTSYWYVKVTSAQLLINGGVGDKASIGELTINKAEKTSSTVNVEIAADIKVCTPSNFSVETNLIGPDKSNVYTNKTSFSASSDVTDKALQLELPLGSQTGTYTANFYLFDTGTGVMLHSASITIEHTKNVGVDPVVVAITPSTEISTNQPVVLTCKAKSVSSGATIVGVKAPGASVHNGKNEALYTTEKNGTYTFTVYYRENGTDKSKDISYTVKNITLSLQTITWNQDLSVVEIDTPVTLNATASSQLAVTYEVSDPNMATIENGILTFLKIGEVTITALQGGGSGFSSAVPVAKKITVRKATHTLTWDQTFETAKVDVPMELTAVSSKNIAVVYNSSDNAIASIIGNKLTFHQINKQVTITATSGNDKYDTETASKNITITQKGDTPTDAEYPEIGTGDNTPKPGETITFPGKTEDGRDIIYTATPADGATIVKVGDEYRITINKVGKVTITATVKGDANHEDGTKDFVINVEGKGNHTLNWDQTFEAAKVDIPMELTAVSSKNIAVVYNSSDNAIASIIGNKLTFHQVNKLVTITASSGDDNYKTETTSKDITITQKGDTPTDAEYPEIGTGDNTPKPGEALVFPSKTTDGKDITYTATPADGATILKVNEEYHITIVKVGKVIITANIAGDANHEDASKDFVVDVISKGTHTLTWNQSFETAKVGVEITLTAVSSKNVAVLYTSSDDAIASIVGNKLTFHQVNKLVTITASSGDDNYKTETTSKDITITQKGDTPTDAEYPEIGTGDNTPKPGETITFPGKTEDGRDIIYTATPADGATIVKVGDEYRITINKVGKVTITATVAGDANHENGTKDFVVNVEGKGIRSIDWTQDISETTVGEKITLTASATPCGGIVKYTSSDTSLAYIKDNTVIAIKEGTVSLRAVVDEDMDFNGVTMGKSMKINPLIIDENTDGDALPDEPEILDKITVTIKEDGTLNLDKELGEAGEDVHIKEMVIQQKDQYVGSIYANAANNVYPGKLTLKAEFTPNKWHFVSFPFNLKISDINKVYGADYFIAVYDTEQRAENKRSNWKMLEVDANTVLKTNQGYLIQTMGTEMVLEIATTDAGQIKKAFTTEDVNLSLACPDANGTASQYNKGWNFVGTPYLSFYKSSFDNKILYVYDEKTETYIPVGKDLDLESYNLRPWSGFMLQSGNASEILPFLSSDRANSQLPQSIRAYNGNAGNRFAFELRRGDSSDRMIVTLNKEASNDYVINEDAAKFFSMNTELPQIYTMTQDGGAVAMNCIPECNEGKFSLVAKTPIAADYELVMTEIPDGFNDVILRGGGKNIVLKQGEPYIFAANAGEESFDVVYSRGSVNIEKEIIDGTFMSVNGSTLQIGELPLGTEIRLFSSTGALLHSTYTKDTTFSYELPADGVYIVRITINGLEKVFKVIR